MFSICYIEVINSLRFVRMKKDEDDEDFYFLIDLKFDVFVWPYFGTDSYCSQNAMTEGT